jgi:hypothetical protein
MGGTIYALAAIGAGTVIVLMAVGLAAIAMRF